MRQPSTSYRLSEDGRKKLAGLSKTLGVNQTAVLEYLIRKEDRALAREKARSLARKKP